MVKWLIIFFLILFDQLTKQLALRFHPSSLSFNQGISFGWGQTGEWLLINGVLLLVLGLMYFKNHSLAMTLILAGGLSNFFDRIIRGEIVDWIRIAIFPWTFNAADAAITLGIIILLHYYLASLLKNLKTI